jgi:hypothetical protein
LHFAVEKKKYKILEEICIHSNIDVVDNVKIKIKFMMILLIKLGRTPLHYAASYGDLKALKILICARANVNYKSIVIKLIFYKKIKKTL